MMPVNGTKRRREQTPGTEGGDTAGGEKSLFHQLKQLENQCHDIFFVTFG